MGNVYVKDKINLSGMHNLLDETKPLLSCLYS